MSEFSRLSEYDFELLVRDLLSAEFNVRFESFARGRDKGIDLRYLAPAPPFSLGRANTRPDIVVQCKHYARTGFSGLKSKLNRQEKAKVEKLAPKRYILATSVDLTPDNKSDIRSLFGTRIISDSDILGASDLGLLLTRHPAVERIHYKLWLTSTAVLDKVLHSEIYQQTEHVLRNLKQNAIRYVQNLSYPIAREMLSRTHVCIIAGRAGIGKTTLAEMLLLEHIANGYQPIVVSQDAGEANRLWNPDPSILQIFYYDDFLGQAATADKLNKNEDDRLNTLIIRIAGVKNKRLILTTREYILEQAKQDYERLQRMNLDTHKHVVRLEDYTKLHRAQILYNHLYFSDLEDEVKSSIVRDRTYLKIIAHENYTPRLIDDIARRAFMDGVDAVRFPRYFLAILDDPRTLWAQTFDHSLSPEARLVLLSLASLPTSTTLQALRAVYDSLQASDTGKPFFYALKEVDGDFLRTAQAEKLSIVSFFNPSVRDFVRGRLLDNIPFRNRLLSAIPYFDQAVALHAQAPDVFAGAGLCGALQRTFRSQECDVAVYGDPRNRFYQLAASNRVSRMVTVLSMCSPADISKAWLDDTCKGFSEHWMEGDFGAGSDIIELLDGIQALDPALAKPMIDAVTYGLRGREMEEWDDAEFAREFIQHYYDAISEEDYDAITTPMKSVIDAEIENLLDLTDPDEISVRLKKVQEMSDEFGHQISRENSLKVEGHLSSLREEYHGIEDWNSKPQNSAHHAPRADEDDVIHDMFDSMERE